MFQSPVNPHVLHGLGSGGVDVDEHSRTTPTSTARRMDRILTLPQKPVNSISVSVEFHAIFHAKSFHSLEPLINVAGSQITGHEARSECRVSGLRCRQTQTMASLIELGTIAHEIDQPTLI